MRLIGLAVILAVSFTLAPLPVEAQPTGKVPVIGLLSASELSPWVKAFRPALADLGWVEGRNVRFEDRSAEGRHERLWPLAEELVRLDVTVIITTDGTAAASAPTS